MSASAKKVHWCNGTQNHQNNQLLPVQDPKIKGHETIKLYQWKMCVQFHSQVASEKGMTMNVGDKIRKDGKIIQSETLP
eukprot:7542777-Ditylum_brightwellii.AAC.1